MTNLIFVMSDDHAAHAISAYGSVVNRTPHIDRIAEEGVRLDRVAAIGAVGDELATRPQGGEDGTRAGVPRVVLVTSAIHMKRTVLTAQYLGIEPLPLNSNYRQIASPSWRAWFPNNGTVWSIRSLLHEVIGIYAYQLSGKG